MVLLQSKTLTADDPAFHAAIADAVKTVSAFPQVSNVRSPLDPEQAGLISKDGHSALVQFTPEGSYDDAILYIDKIAAAVDKVETRHAGLSIESVGVSTEKKLDAVIQSGLAKVGLISIPLTILVLMLVLGSLTAAMVPLLVALTSIVATTGLVALASQGVAADENIIEVILLVGLAVGVDYSLFYIRREREERAAGRSEGAALAAAAATSGRAILVSGITVLIAMAGMFLSGDKTFMSFSVGTMLVVLVAMIGSLTVLPAVLSKLGDRVEKGRIPFVHRLRRSNRGDGMWSAILDRVLRRPLVSALAATAVLLVLAMPALTLHTSETGIDGISTPVVAAVRRRHGRVPGHPGAGRGRDHRRRRQRRAGPRGDRRARAQGARDRRDARPDQRREQPRRNRGPGRDPARRQRHRRRLDRGARNPARRRSCRRRSASSTASSTP